MKSSKFKDVSVIVLAAGSGTRTELKTPKQYLKVGGKRIIEYSFDTFSKFIENIVVVLPQKNDWSKLGIKANVNLVSGGLTRTDSLLNGLSQIKTEKVLIHDASRPLIPEDVLKNIVDGLDDYDCVYPVIPIASSIVVDRDGELQSTPDRSKFREIQTPQGFKTEVLEEALRQFSDSHPHVPELVRWLGKTVMHVEGSPWLFKITYEPDVYAAKVKIESQNNGHPTPES